MEIPEQKLFDFESRTSDGQVTRQALEHFELQVDYIADIHLQHNQSFQFKSNNCEYYRQIVDCSSDNLR